MPNAYVGFLHCTTNLLHFTIFSEIIVIKQEPLDPDRPIHPDSRAAMRNMLDQYQEEKNQDQREIDELKIRLAQYAADNMRLKESKESIDKELVNIKAEKECLESDVNRQKQDVTGLKQDLDKFKAEKGDLQEDLKKIQTDKEKLEEQLKLMGVEKEKTKEQDADDQADENVDKDGGGGSDDKDDGAVTFSDDDDYSPSEDSEDETPEVEICTDEVKILQGGLCKVYVTALQYPKTELKDIRKDLSRIIGSEWYHVTEGQTELRLEIAMLDDKKRGTRSWLSKKMEEYKAERDTLKEEVESLRGVIDRLRLEQLRRVHLINQKKEEVSKNKVPASSKTSTSVRVDEDVIIMDQIQHAHDKGETMIAGQGAKSGKVQVGEKLTGYQALTEG